MCILVVCVFKKQRVVNGDCYLFRIEEFVSDPLYLVKKKHHMSQRELSFLKESNI